MSLLLSGLASAALVGSQLFGPNTPLRPLDTIVFFGDSITWQGGFIDLLAKRIHEQPATKRLLVSLVKRGINGGKSNDLLNGCTNLYGSTQAPFAEVLERGHPTLAVIEIGINDIWHGSSGNPPEKFRVNLEAMVETARKKSVQLVFATPPIIGELPRGKNAFDSKLDEYSAIVRDVAKTNGFEVADLREAFVNKLDSLRGAKDTTDRGRLTYDGVHMLPTGNELIADRLAESIAKQLTKLRKPQVAKPSRVSIVPMPRKVTLGGGQTKLEKVRIFAPQEFRDLSRSFLADLRDATGVEASLTARMEDSTIVLSQANGFEEEGYSLTIGKRVVLSASHRVGASWGLATLLQLAKRSSSGLLLPTLKIDDRPHFSYRGLLVDVARKHHSIETLKQCVLLCRLYKIRYLQLHLTDDQAFTFPSSAFPKVTSQNGVGLPAYTLDELRELVTFADSRGVAIVPEFDLPGHCGSLVRTMPEVFKISGTKPYEHHATINFVNSKALSAVETMIDEMCQVFHTSPYFHMGGDEADIAMADQHPDFRAAFGQLDLPDKSQHELFRRFIAQVNEIVKGRSKTLIVWEGFGRDSGSRFPIPKDVRVMEFENAYYLPGDLLEDGYSVINASWTPLYVVGRHVWPASKVYEWDAGLFGKFGNLYQTTGWLRVNDSRAIQGAQVCSWEGNESIEIQNLRRVVAAMSERTWNPFEPDDYRAYTARFATSDAVLENLVHPVRMSHSALDATDANGFDVPCFSSPITVELDATRAGMIRFTTDDNPPTASSESYKSPIEIKETTTIRAALFDEHGQQLGYETSMRFYHVPKRVPNLATGKPVSISGGTQSPQDPELAVDDNLDLSSSWWSGSSPQWLRVDLGKSYSVNKIELFPYWDGTRFYQYTIEVSEDGIAWTIVADRSENRLPSSANGDEVRFAARKVRFVRVNMLKNSANAGVHIVELKVWEAKSSDKNNARTWPVRALRKTAH